MVSGEPLRFEGVLETVLYYRTGQQNEMRHFYGEVLRLPSIPGGLDGFRIGAQVFLLFNADDSSVQDDPPPHGAAGTIHTCFTSQPQLYEGWKQHLRDQAVEILREITWPNAVESFYFRDPAGNLLEIANGDLWPG